jgi:hypothetical protein
MPTRRFRYSEGKVHGEAVAFDFLILDLSVSTRIGILRRDVYNHFLSLHLKSLMTCLATTVLMLFDERNTDTTQLFTCTRLLRSRVKSRGNIHKDGNIDISSFAFSIDFDVENLPRSERNPPLPREKTRKRYSLSLPNFSFSFA